MEERFLVFSAAGESFAMNLREVAEVMEPQQIYPVPRTPPYFTGLINFHGTLTALVDLARYLGNQGRTAGGKVLVLDLKGAQLALTVDEVASIIPREAITEEEPGKDLLTAAMLRTEGGRLRLLHAETILFALEQGL